MITRDVAVVADEKNTNGGLSGKRRVRGISSEPIEALGNCFFKISSAKISEYSSSSENKDSR